MTTPSYDLHTLGWKSFKDLCIAVAEECLRHGALATSWHPHVGNGIRLNAIRRFARASFRFLYSTNTQLES